MLQSIGKTSLTPRLQDCVNHVQARVDHVLSTDVCGETREVWKELRRSLSKLRTKRSKSSKDSTVSTISSSTQAGCTAADAYIDMFWEHTRLRRLNRSITRWNNYAGSIKLACAVDAKNRLAEILRGPTIDTVELRKFVYDVIGALAPPRSKFRPSDDPVHFDQKSLRRLEAVQRWTRQILIKAITTWRDTLWLEDEQIEPVLELVRWFVRQFEEQHGNLSGAGAGAQWTSLRLIVDATRGIKRTADELPKDTAVDRVARAVADNLAAERVKPHKLWEATLSSGPGIVYCVRCGAFMSKGPHGLARLLAKPCQGPTSSLATQRNRMKAGLHPFRYACERLIVSPRPICTEALL